MVLENRDLANCGTSVDTEFFNILEDIIGTENMKKFRNENTIEYLEICSSFESVKRNITRQQTEMINIAIPIAYTYSSMS
jgi:hypothetical protein